tara:strand:- start:217 stop:390 length:174 start_codon:yes stop_codon:yes gene_type:complete
MDASTIITRLESIKDSIEYEEMSITEVYDAITGLVDDIESVIDYDADFGDIQFDDLD